MLLTGHQRLFFALAPDDGARAKLAHLATQAHHALNDSHARVVDTGTLHLTLAFLGEVSDEVARDLGTWLNDFQPPTFSLELSSIDRFGGADVLWVGPLQTPRALTELVGAVNDRATSAGLTLEDRPYRPHVTLVRKARSLPPSDCELIAQLAAQPIVWSVSHCVLMRSITTPKGVRYDIAASSRRN